MCGILDIKWMKVKYIMIKALPKKKMYRYCLADIAKGLFNGMIGNYLLYFFQPTVKSGLPNLLPQSKLLGFITVMALITGIGKVVDAVTDPLVATLRTNATIRLAGVCRFCALRQFLMHFRFC